MICLLPFPSPPWLGRPLSPHRWAAHPLARDDGRGREDVDVGAARAEPELPARLATRAAVQGGLLGAEEARDRHHACRTAR